MSQAAIVKRVVSPGVVEVSLLRQMECALGCKDCEGCLQKPKEELCALASNDLGAVPGDVVEVRSAAGGTVSAAALVYVLPCIALILAYLLVSRLGWNESICIGVSLFGLLLGFLPARWIDRAVRKGSPTEFTILSVVRT